MNKESLYHLHELTASDDEQPLFAVLADQIPGLSRSQARKAIQAGLVEVNGEPCLEPQRKPSTTASIRCDFRQGIDKKYQLARFAPAEEELPFKILHHDEHFVIIDKAAGVLSAPTQKGERGAVSDYLRRWLRAQGDKRPFTGYIHRLDKETSGCLCFARTRRAQKALAAQFAHHGAGRRYRCLVLGGPRQDQDVLKGRIGRGRDGRRAVVPDNLPGKNAVTHFDVVQRFTNPNISELKIRLETGRTHQIRIHMAYIGCPVLGEPVYGDPHAKAQRATRLMLHASGLELDHPETGQRMRFSADLPEAYLAQRQKLTKS